MSRSYGLPYKGSKNSIAKWIIENLPEADILYDLFGGGGAITHCAIESNKYKAVVYNELQTRIADLFNKVVKGEFKDEKRWVSREDFNKYKDTDGYIASVWSFGNSCKNYLYSKEIEPWKKAIHYAVVFEDYSLLKEFGIDISLTGFTSNDRRLEFRKLAVKNKAEYKEKYIKWYVENVMYTEVDYACLRLNLTQKIKKNKEELRQYLIDARDNAGITSAYVNKYLGTQMAGHYFGKSQWAFPTESEYNKLKEIMPTLKPYIEVYGYQQLCEAVQSLESLERLERLQSLESLERLQSLDTLCVLNLSYESVEIKNNSIIYCDIPYKNTDKYTEDEFDYKKFYDWCCSQSVPVYVSEYNIDDDRFEIVAEKEKRVLFNQTNKGTKTERLYRVKR